MRKNKCTKCIIFMNEKQKYAEYAEKGGMQRCTFSHLVMVYE